jgi:hypothetical protein
MGSTQFQVPSFCYLCGETLVGRPINEDHVVQKQFIKRAQPRAKGFYYAGKLPTHVECNSKFGGKDVEGRCQQSLELLRYRYDPSRYFQKIDDPSFIILALNPSSLPSFTTEDVAFFGLIDGQHEAYENVISKSFLSQYPKMDPFPRACNIAITVLMKSAAANLVKREIISQVPRWKVLAIPLFGGFDLSRVFRQIEQLEVGVRFGIQPLGEEDYAVGYQVNDFVIVFGFAFSKDSLAFKQLATAFKNAGCLMFNSEKLLDLLGYDWYANKAS